MAPTIFISAGEASGEHYGALLIHALEAQLASAGQSATYFGMGGERMAAAGLRRVVRSEDMAVMGITEVIRHLPRIFAGFRKLKRSIRDRRPDVAVLIDFPDIHFKLARELHRLGVPVVFFVSPQLWAWKKGRIKLVQQYVTRMLVIFPFEEAFYRERAVVAEFVGHPLADLPLPTISREDFAKQAAHVVQDHWRFAPPGTFPPGQTRAAGGPVSYELDPAKEWIALLPGSRWGEIRRNLGGMVEAAALLGANFEYIIPLAPTLTQDQIRSIQYELGNYALGNSGLTSAPRITFVTDARAALLHARASIVASGTATVEAALIGNPFVVVYRVSPLTYAIARRVVSVPHVAMANLIAGKRVVPELIQHDFTAPKIVQHLGPLLPDGPPRESMMKELRSVGESLRSRQAPQSGNLQSAIERVAAITLELLSGPARP